MGINYDLLELDNVSSNLLCNELPKQHRIVLEIIASTPCGSDKYQWALSVIGHMRDFYIALISMYKHIDKEIIYVWSNGSWMYAFEYCEHEYVSLGKDYMTISIPSIVDPKDYIMIVAPHKLGTNSSVHSYFTE